MGDVRDTKVSLRKDAAAGKIIRAWRSLTGGPSARDSQRPTLVACSGGADSAALALTLWAASDHLTVAHVVHDLRPPEQAHADRDAVRALAASLGVHFVEESVGVTRERGNSEGVARRLRYQALVKTAESTGCHFIATGHQGDDLLETMLMRLMRGAGPRGLAAIQASRSMTGTSVRLIRPMLGVTRADCERLCCMAAVEWRHDATNQDISRVRAALRAQVMPQLKQLCPSIGERALTSSRLLAAAAGLTATLGGNLLAKAERSDEGIRWPRRALRDEPGLVVTEALRLAAANLADGAGLDRLSARVLEAVMEAIAGPSTEPRSYHLGPAAVTVTARYVEVHRHV